MKAQTQKLTTAAVCTALAVMMCAMTAYLPLSFMPLFIAAFCIFLACKRGSLPYGVLCALASVGLMFLMTGLTVKWFAFVIVFAPYGIVTYFINKLVYYKLKTALLRILIVAVYFNVTIGAVYAIAINVAAVGMSGMDVNAWVSVLGGYAVLAVIATVVLLPLDLVFTGLATVILKKIPARKTKEEILREKRSSESEKNAAEEPKYDIFGYEINHDKDDKKE